MPDSTLGLYAHGKLSGELAEKVECHLEDCTECESRTNEFSLKPRLDLPSRFNVERHLGAGGYGDVYLCRDSLLERQVAVKRLKTLRSPDGWLEEARNAAKVLHENVIRVFDVIENPPCIVTEYVEGKDLATLLEESTFTSEEAARITKSIAEGIAAIHREGLVHGDVKPKNVLQSKDGRIVITDFGLSADLMRFSTEDLYAAGTIYYLAPEQVKFGYNNISIGTDVYAIGAVFYELLTGKLPFRGGKEELLRRIPQGDVMDPRGIRPSIPQVLEMICKKAMSTNRDSRFGQADDIVQEIEQHFRSRDLSRSLLKIKRVGLFVLTLILAAIVVIQMTGSPPASLVNDFADLKKQVGVSKQTLNPSDSALMEASLEKIEIHVRNGQFASAANLITGVRKTMDSLVRSSQFENILVPLTDTVKKFGGRQNVLKRLPGVTEDLSLIYGKSNTIDIDRLLVALTKAQLDKAASRVQQAIEKEICYTSWQLGLTTGGISASFSKLSSVDEFFTSGFEYMDRFRRTLPVIARTYQRLNLDPAALLEIQKTSRDDLPERSKFDRILHLSPRELIKERWGAKAEACHLLGCRIAIFIGNHRERESILIAVSSSIDSGRETSLDSWQAQMIDLLKTASDATGGEEEASTGEELRNFLNRTRKETFEIPSFIFR